MPHAATAERLPSYSSQYPLSLGNRRLRLYPVTADPAPSGRRRKTTQSTAKIEMQAPQTKPARTPPERASMGAAPPLANLAARADINATNSATPAAPAA